MALPKISLPLYQINLPSTGEKIQFRPFTVKEEKILLTAQETRDTGQIVLAIKQIINNCVLEKDVNKMSVFDIEYLLIQLRAKSVDNKIEFEITDADTQEPVKLAIDISELKVEKNPNHTNAIKISDKYTLFLKYPSIDDFQDLLGNSNQEDGYKLMTTCFDKLASEDEVYNFKDFQEEEVNEFVEGLHGDIIKNIKVFFDTMPKMKAEIKYINSRGDNKVFVVQGTQSFFI